MKNLICLLIISVLTCFIAQAQYSAININSQEVTKGIGSVASDNDGNMIVTGNFLTTITIGGTTLTNSNPDNYSNFGSNAAFIAKMTPAGSYSWVKNIVINKPPSKNLCGTLYSGVQILGISTDASGNIYLTGSFYGSVSFGSTTLLTAQMPKGACQPYNKDIFTTKMSPNGDFLWTKKAGISSGWTDYGYSVVSDAAGNAYTTGVLVQKDINAEPCNYGVQTYAYVVKYNATGTKIWEKKYANNYASCGYTIEGTSNASDGSNIYVSGHFLGTVNFGNNFSFTVSTINQFLLKLDGNGNTVWAKIANTNQHTSAYLLMDDNGQDVYVNGRFTGTSTFGTNTITSNGSNQYLAKYSTSSGNCSWAIIAGVGVSKRSFFHPNGTIGLLNLVQPTVALEIKEFSTGGVLMNTTSTTNINAYIHLRDVVSTPDGFVYSHNLKGSYDMDGVTIASTQATTSSFSDMILVKYSYTAPLPISYIPSNENNKQIRGDELYVRINQNPSHDQFALLIKSKDKNPVSIRVLDVQGRVVETRNANPNEDIIMIGEKLRPGIYYAEIIQGNERRIEKILKIE